MLLILFVLEVPDKDLSALFCDLIKKLLGVTPDLRAGSRHHVALNGLPVLSEQVQG